MREGGGYGGRSDRLIDLRVDEHPTPIAELERIHAMHRTLFGETPRERTGSTSTRRCASEIAMLLAERGYEAATTADAFGSWADTENLEERVDGFDRVDPVVLDELRRRALTALPTFSTRCSYTPPRQSFPGHASAGRP